MIIFLSRETDTHDPFQMNTTTILVAVLTALTFSLWPIMAKYSGATFAWVNLLLYTGGLISVSVMGHRRLTTEHVTVRAVVILIIVGLVNGLAVWFYTVKAVDKEINTALFMVTVSLVGLISAPILNLVINGETLTAKQWVAALLSIVVIWLLKK